VPDRGRRQVVLGIFTPHAPRIFRVSYISSIFFVICNPLKKSRSLPLLITSELIFLGAPTASPPLPCGGFPAFKGPRAIDWIPSNFRKPKFQNPGLNGGENPPSHRIEGAFLNLWVATGEIKGLPRGILGGWSTSLRAVLSRAPCSHPPPLGPSRRALATASTGFNRTKFDGI